MSANSGSKNGEHKEKNTWATDTDTVTSSNEAGHMSKLTIDERVLLRHDILILSGNEWQTRNTYVTPTVTSNDDSRHMPGKFVSTHST